MNSLAVKVQLQHGNKLFKKKEKEKERIKVTVAFYKIVAWLWLRKLSCQTF